MKNKGILLSIPLTLMCLLSGCSTIGNKSMSMSIIYIVATIISFLILVGYATFSNKKNVWYLLLFSSVFIVNIGYTALSVSTEINEALLANRISYFGSVFLPLSMLMLIMDACKIKYKKWLPIALVCISVPVFLIAASPGYSDIYYKSASLVIANGFTTLDKEYGSLHSVYLYYLIGYFASMIATIIYSVAKKKIETSLQAIILFTAVFINIGIWLLEQLVHIEFELLSVSYIASELFLLFLSLLHKEQQSLQAKNITTENYIANDIETKIPAVTTQTVEMDNAEVQTYIESNNDIIVETKSESEVFAEKCQYFESQIKNLTPTEHTIYELYMDKKSTKEVLDILNIKETTLKYHNKNIYGKLGVSSKKQLLEIADVIYK